VANNWRLAGKMVREGKLCGVAFDTEQYVTTLFRYGLASRGGQYTWPQCVDMVYRRGQQAMRALNSEVTELDILTMFAHGYVWRIMNNRGIKSVRHTSCALMPAFLDGMISVKAPGTRIFDGWEGAYRYKKRESFAKADKIMRHHAAEISLAPAAYKKHIRTSYGIWICDAKGRWDPNNPYYEPAEFEEALRYAFEFTDRYVWVYHERIQPWALHPTVKQVRFPEPYWRALCNAAVAASQPLGARPLTRPAPAGQPAQRGEAKPVAHWPLTRSLDNAVTQGVPLRSAGDAPARFEGIGDDGGTALLLDGKDDHVAVAASDLPAELAENATVSVTLFPSDAQREHRYPIVAGALSRRGPVFELAAVGDGSDLRLEVTTFDPRTGIPTGYQTTDFDYVPYTTHAISVRFEAGRFAGMFVNRHQAIFGLWDLAADPRPIPKRRAATDRLFVGYVVDVRLFDVALSREQLNRLADAKPDWETPMSPGDVLLDLENANTSEGLIPDRWKIPRSTPFLLKTNGGRVPQIVTDGDEPGLRFRPAWQGYVEAVNAGRDSHPLVGFAYTVKFRLDSLPPAGAACGLFGRGGGGNGDTSFSVYVDADGRAFVHGKSTTNFAKNVKSGPNQVKPGQSHTLTFSLDRPNGMLTLTLDGRRIGQTRIAHDNPDNAQSIRYVDLPLRIGHVRVLPDSYAPFVPEPTDCYLDGVITDFRIERISQ